MGGYPQQAIAGQQQPTMGGQPQAMGGHMQHAMVSHPSQHTRGSQPQLTIGGHPQQQIGAGQQAAGEAGGDQPTPPQKQDAEKTMTAPEVPVPPVSSVILNNGVLESSNKGAQKSKGKPFCYRCHTKGHTIHECTVVLCCDLCCGDHVTKICPNMKK
jgi:hypothetical protein